MSRQMSRTLSRKNNRETSRKMNMKTRRKQTEKLAEKCFFKSQAKALNTTKRVLSAGALKLLVHLCLNLDTHSFLGPSWPNDETPRT
jgi:hypothetical protein